MISNRDFFAQFRPKQTQPAPNAPESLGPEEGNQPSSVITNDEKPDMVTEGETKTPGSFAPEEKEKRIVIREHEISSVPITQIQNVDSIPDYDPSQSLHPVVCRTEKGAFCIDDYWKIAAAEEAGQNEIKCEVLSLSGHSEIDLMLRKTARRIMPAGGRAPFSQIAVNVRSCFEKLLASENYVLFGQGGDRLTPKFTQDKQIDVRLVLQSRFGRNRDTINEYLGATEHLNEEIKHFLFQNKVPKAFFNGIRKNKNELINTMKAEKLPTEKIVEAVSIEIRKWYEQYLNPAAAKESAQDSFKVQGSKAPASGSEDKSKLSIPPNLSKAPEPNSLPSGKQEALEKTGAGDALVSIEALIGANDEISALSGNLVNIGKRLMEVGEKVKPGITKADASTLFLTLTEIRTGLQEIIPKFQLVFEIDKNSKEITENLPRENSLMMQAP